MVGYNSIFTTYEIITTLLLYKLLFVYFYQIFLQIYHSILCIVSTTKLDISDILIAIERTYISSFKCHYGTASSTPTYTSTWRTIHESISSSVQERVESSTPQHGSSTGHDSRQTRGSNNSNCCCRSIEVDEATGLSWWQFIHPSTKINV